MLHGTATALPGSSNGDCSRPGRQHHIRTQSPDTTPEAKAALIAGLQRLGPARRLQMANDLTPMTRRYPTASEDELRYRGCALL
jgi:hypothetical protein